MQRSELNIFWRYRPNKPLLRIHIFIHPPLVVNVTGLLLLLVLIPFRHSFGSQHTNKFDLKIMPLEKPFFSLSLYFFVSPSGVSFSGVLACLGFCHTMPFTTNIVNPFIHFIQLGGSQSFGVKQKGLPFDILRWMPVNSLTR